jgi:hypothetical protein
MDVEFVLEATMKLSVLVALAGLNAILLCAFVGRVFHPASASAQIHRPADYLLIPGNMQTGLTDAVYIVDTTNGQLGAMAYDDSSHTLQVMPPINLDAIYNSAGVTTK